MHFGTARVGCQAIVLGKEIATETSGDSRSPGLGIYLGYFLGRRFFDFEGGLVRDL